MGGSLSQVHWHRGHRDDKVAVTIAHRTKNSIQPSGTQRTKDSRDMSVRRTPVDHEGAISFGMALPPLSKTCTPPCNLQWQEGEVGPGALLDLSVLAVGLAQEDRRWRIPVRDDVDVHGPIMRMRTALFNYKNVHLHGCILLWISPRCYRVLRISAFRAPEVRSSGYRRGPGVRARFARSSSTVAQGSRATRKRGSTLVPRLNGNHRRKLHCTQTFEPWTLPCSWDRMPVRDL